MTSIRIAAVVVATLLSSAAAAVDLAGHVADAKGHALPGAHVYVAAAFPKVGISTICPSCYRDCGKHVSVDSRGSFEVKGLDPLLKFDLLAVADGYEPLYLRRVDPARGAVRFELTPRSAADLDRLITGFVERPDGKPVTGAVVEPSGYRIGRRVGFGAIPGVEQLSITNGRGEFQLRIPDPNGTLDVRVTARGFAPYIERGFRPGKHQRVCVNEGVTVTGRVVRDGRAVAGMPVVVVQTNRESSGFLGRFEIGTDTDGRFVLTDMAPDVTWAAGVPMESVPGEVVDPIEFHTGEAGRPIDAGTLHVTSGRLVSGWLAYPAGVTPRRNARVIVSSELNGNARSVAVARDGSFFFEAAPSGSVVLGADVRGFKLSPQSSGYQRLRQMVVLPTEGDVRDLCLVLVPAGE